MEAYYLQKIHAIIYLLYGLIYLLHFKLKSTTHALALKPKPLVVRSTDHGRDPGSLKNGIVCQDYGIVRRDALALKPKPLVVRIANWNSWATDSA